MSEGLCANDPIFDVPPLPTDEQVKRFGMDGDGPYPTIAPGAMTWTQLDTLRHQIAAFSHLCEQRALLTHAAGWMRAEHQFHIPWQGFAGLDQIDQKRRHIGHPTAKDGKLRVGGDLQRAVQEAGGQVFGRTGCRGKRIDAPALSLGRAEPSANGVVGDLIHPRLAVEVSCASVHAVAVCLNKARVGAALEEDDGDVSRLGSFNQQAAPPAIPIPDYNGLD